MALFTELTSDLGGLLTAGIIGFMVLGFPAGLYFVFREMQKPS
jgi:hypothetical protein